MSDTLSDDEKGMLGAVERERAAREEMAQGLDLTPGGPYFPAEQPKPDMAGAKPDDFDMQGELQKLEDTANPPPTPPPENDWLRMDRELRDGRNKPPPQNEGELADARSIGWLPPEEPATAGKPAKAGEPDFEAMLREVQRAEGSAGLDRSIQQALHAAAPGFDPDMHAGEGRIAAAKAPLEMAQAKQKFEAEQAAHDEKLLAQQKEHEKNDPNSADSQRARAALKPIFDMAGSTPADFDKWSAADVEAHAKTLTPIAKDVSETNRAQAKAKEGEQQKASALADRKKLMLSQYPEHAKEIEALNDLGDAQTFQTALEGRMGREQSQAATEKGRKETQAHEDQAQRERERFEVAMAARRQQDAKDLKDWEAKNKDVSPEDRKALEGYAQAPGIVDLLEKHADSLDTFMKKAAAAHPEIAGMLGAPGADFKANQELAASMLAQIVDHGVARPGTIAIARHYLPEPTDSKETRAEKIRGLREMLSNSQRGFLAGLSASGVRPVDESKLPAWDKGGGPPAPGTVTVMHKKTRQSRNVSPEKAKAILAAPGGDAYEVVGEPNQ